LGLTETGKYYITHCKYRHADGFSVEAQRCEDKYMKGIFERTWRNNCILTMTIRNSTPLC